MNEDKSKSEKKERISDAERQKQNQDFENIPASSENQSPPDIDKKDIKKSSDANNDGKMDNTEKE